MFNRQKFKKSLFWLSISIPCIGLGWTQHQIGDLIPIEGWTFFYVLLILNAGVVSRLNKRCRQLSWGITLVYLLSWGILARIVAAPMEVELFQTMGLFSYQLGLQIVNHILTEKKEGPLWDLQEVKKRPVSEKETDRLEKR